MAGVTSARDLGAPLEASIAVRDRLRKGEIPGQLFMSPVRLFSTNLIPALITCVGV